MRFGAAAVLLAGAFLFTLVPEAFGQATETIVDIPTRPGVTQRMLVIAPPEPKAAVVLLAGGHGGLQLASDGSMRWGQGNFLIRTRRLFAEQGFVVAVVDAPSDKQSPPFLDGFRQTPEHAADLKAVLAWLRDSTHAPVWLIGTSRGTQSAAYLATQLAAGDAPDGIVLTSSILRDGGRPVTAMPLEKVRIPVLVVHHEQDGCALCPFADVPVLMSKLDKAPRAQLLAFKGGTSRGDPCEAFAYHGFNGIEREVVEQIAAWITAR